MIDFFRRFFRRKETSPPAVQTPADDQSVDVLARTIYGEARGQPYAGMVAVANVVLNRVRKAQRYDGGYWWGNDIVGVCLKPYQFSCWNKNDPNLSIIKKVTASDQGFRDCLEIARRAVDGHLSDNTNGATHYHADYVSPYWAANKSPVAAIGAHLFYKL